MENKVQIKNIVILGGGTAGWMTANLLASKWNQHAINITLVESPEIGIIGVGEGSTPKLKDFFDALDIKESEWMPECNATFKNGIKFKNWSTVKDYEEYFHPFGCTIDALTYKLFRANAMQRQKGFDVDARPDRFFLMAKLAEKKLAPLAPENFPFQFDYSYHFDSVLLGKFLKKKAVANGVNHIEGRVEDVELTPSGDICNLSLKDGTKVAADFFVDCSGFSSILLQKSLKVPFVSYKENLFNDAAVAMPTQITEKIPSQTVSTAFKNGWAWQIPLTNRFGNGYVYSSDFCSAEQAEIELRTELGLLDSDVEARHLKMKVGLVEKSWHKNCVAIGLSQGFIEPLEATALQFVYSAVEEFMQAFEMGGFTNQNQDIFNKRMDINFAGIRDYIVLHYKTNTRIDTDYWRANRENNNIPENLKGMLHYWDSGKGVEEGLNALNIGKHYTALSWNCLLAGVGRFPKESLLKQVSKQKVEVDLEYIDNFINGCSLNFKEHQLALMNMAKNL